MQRLGTAEKRPELLLMSPELEKVQDLMPMSPDDLTRLKDDIKQNGIRHPLICYNASGKYFVLAGWHRRQIAIDLNIDIVPVEIVESKPKERREFCITENLARRHLTQDQKKKIAQTLIKAAPETSARTIAEKVGISPTTASTIKKKSGVQIGHVKGKDNKKYSIKTKPGKAKIKDNTPPNSIQPLDAGMYVLTENGYKPESGRNEDREAQIKQQISLYVQTLSADDQAAFLDSIFDFFNNI